MKKISLLAFLLISIFTFSTVKAEPFTKVFETEQLTGFGDYSNNISYKDGYVTTNAVEEGTVINYYDRNGEQLKTNELESKVVLDLIADNDDLYLLVGFNNSQEMKVYKLNDNLEVIDEISIGEINPGNIIEIMFYGFDVMNLVGKEIAIDTTFGIVTINKETNNVNIVANNDTNLKKYFPNIYYSLNIFSEPVPIDYKNGYLAAAEASHACVSGDSPTPGVIGYILNPDEALECGVYALDYGSIEDDEITFRTTLTGEPMRIRILKDYIAVIEAIRDRDIIEIFDLEGNLVQTITPSKYVEIYSLKPTDAGFIYLESACRAPKGRKASIETCQISHKVYTSEHKITVNVSQGKGKVNVISSAVPGEPVTFTIEAEEGYTLGSVKVTDANGNVLEFHEYTFTMPSADVEVEVLFVRNALNPETMDIAIVTIFFVALLAGVLFFVNSKKLNWLK